MHRNSLKYALATLLCAVSISRAGIIFSTPQSSYTLTPTQSVVVPVSLEFTSIDAAALSADGGLLSGAFQVALTGGALPVVITTLTPNTSDFNDPTLTPVLLGPSPTQGGIWEFADLTRTTGVLGQSPDSNTQIILLGNVTFTAPSSVGQTTFQILRYDPTLATTVTFAAPSMTLDGSITSSELTFNVVPEPGIGAVASLAVLTGLRRHSKGGARIRRR